MHDPTASQTRNKSNESHKKLKTFIFVGVLLILIIVGWHVYEHFMQSDKDASDREAANVHEIHEMTKLIYAKELQRNPYLAGVNFQGKTESYAHDDKAPQPLLTLHDELLKAHSKTAYSSTVALMKRLFDNYELDTLVGENVTPAEQQEELDFLHAVMKTPVMQHTMRFLQQKGKVSANYDDQLQLLKDIWFTQYSRGQGRIGSSGFEHVFLAEIKNQNILGLHNWIYFHEQEQLGKLDYKGYIQRLDIDKDNQYLLAVRFTFHDIAKPFNTLFIGTSPELEMSLYTICFLLSVGEVCPVQLGATKFSIITHAWDWRGKKTLATAYPSIEKW